MFDIAKSACRKLSRAANPHTINLIEKVESRIEETRCRLTGRTIVHLLHIRKTGGSAVKSAFLGSSFYGCRYTAQYLLKLHKHGMRLKDVPIGQKVAFFLRDPIERFISGFHCRKRQGKPRYDCPWSPEERFAFTLFDTPTELAIALSSDDEKTRQTAHLAMQQVRHINTPLSFWLDSKAYLEKRREDIFLVGWQDSLGKDFSTLCSLLEIREPVSLPLDDRSAHRNPYRQDVPLHFNAIHNLKSWYKADYELIEFCKRVSVAVKSNTLPNNSRTREVA